MDKYTTEPSPDTIPYGYCHCGCGQQTKIATKKCSVPKGEHYLFAVGHHPRPFLTRFWKKVDVRGSNDCWEWQGIRFPNGYGCIVIKNHKRALTHRVSYELLHGPIPEGMLILHSCDNPPCCNPAHLRVGTTRDNIADSKGRGRANRARGVDAGQVKLTEADVKSIRSAYTPGIITMQAIAAQYGVSYSAVHGVISRATWKHIP
jgi:hypothetical protein